jgi:hypothetical protein
MSLYQFATAIEGYNQVHGGETPIEAPSPEEFYDLCYRLGTAPEPTKIQ